MSSASDEQIARARRPVVDGACPRGTGRGGYATAADAAGPACVSGIVRCGGCWLCDGSSMAGGWRPWGTDE